MPGFRNKPTTNVIHNYCNNKTRTLEENHETITSSPEASEFKNVVFFLFFFFLIRHLPAWGAASKTGLDPFLRCLRVRCGFQVPIDSKFLHIRVSSPGFNDILYGCMGGWLVGKPRVHEGSWLQFKLQKSSPLWFYESLGLFGLSYIAQGLFKLGYYSLSLPHL